MVLDFVQPDGLRQHIREVRTCRRKSHSKETAQSRNSVFVLRKKKHGNSTKDNPLTRKIRENFETKFREKVLGGIYRNSKDEQERDLQLWMNEIE